MPRYQVRRWGTTDEDAAVGLHEGEYDTEAEAYARLEEIERDEQCEPGCDHGFGAGAGEVVQVED